MNAPSVAPATAPRRNVGTLLLIGPWQRAPGRWRVEAVDEVLEERQHKEFASQARAQTFIDALASGQDAVDPLASAPPSKHSVDPTQHAFGQLVRAPTLTKTHTRQSAPPGRARDPDAAPFNLRAVQDVLTAYELDPFAEIAKVLMHKAPLTGRGGTAVLDEEGKPLMVEQVTGVDRAKVLVELAQYVAPKLKAVEMKVEHKDQLTEAQLDLRIAGLMQRLTAAQAVSPTAAGEAGAG